MIGRTRRSHGANRGQKNGALDRSHEPRGMAAAAADAPPSQLPCIARAPGYRSRPNIWFACRRSCPTVSRPLRRTGKIGSVGGSVGFLVRPGRCLPQQAGLLKGYNLGPVPQLCSCSGVASANELSRRPPPSRPEDSFGLPNDGRGQLGIPWGRPSVTKLGTSPGFASFDSMIARARAR